MLFTQLHEREKKKRKTDLRLNEKERDVCGERNKKKKKIGMENFGIALENPNSQCGREVRKWLYLILKTLVLSDSVRYGSF